MLPPMHARCAELSPCLLPYPSNLILQDTAADASPIGSNSTSSTAGPNQGLSCSQGLTQRTDIPLL
jgi:hypothetical protein